MAVALTHVAPQALGPRTPARRATRPAPEVLGPPVFRDALVRERRRADRFGDPFLVLLVELGDVAPRHAPLPWDAVLDAMVAVRRETDLLGWFERGVVLGLLLPESRDERLLSAVERRLKAELARRLDAPAL